MTLFTDAEREAAAADPILRDYADALGLKSRAGIVEPAGEPLVMALVVMRLPAGGYAVHVPGCAAEFASTTIDEALEFINDRMAPE